MSKEHEEARRLWVEALRSGEFKQGRRWLCLDDYYCCLGVACKIFGVEEHHSESGQVAFGAVREGCGMPEEAMQILGLRDPLGRWGELGDGKKSLAGLNDGGASFAEIADIIESNPPSLFTD